LFEKSTRALRAAAGAANKRLALIGAGGVEDGATAMAKIRAGACAIQLYSALAYEGPGLIARILDDLAARLKADGFARLDEAIGAG
jgi:dihydroorotate dehydrogenase